MGGLLWAVGEVLGDSVAALVVPGDPVRSNLGQMAQFDPTAVEAFRHHYGLDQPLPVQYLRYIEHDRGRKPTTVNGYRWIVNGQIVHLRGEHTGALPGRLLRGPLAADATQEG